ncbi:MAG: glycosyltransferase family 9 protein [Burkholderiales bacterium]|nr:glycosyltransferase family 9 protein [Burkholderiales bacterium]
MKVVILKRDKIGDMLLVTPMLAHLRRSLPGAQIHLLANDYNAWVLDGNTDLDRLWVYPRVRHGATLRPWAVVQQWLQIRALKRERFDFAIAAGGVVSPRAAGRILRLGAQRTIAFAGSGPDGHDPVFTRLTDAVPYERALHEVESNLRLLQPLGVGMPAQVPRPRLRLARHWLDAGAAWLAQSGLAPGRFVVIGLNARRVKRKPGAAQIIAWSRHLKEAHGLDSVLIWQPGPADDRVYPGDDEIVRPLLEDAPPWLHPFVNPKDVRGALGVVWHAALSVFPDGGLAHLASASPGGVLALFAETHVSPHPDNWRPWAPRADYLEADRSVTELPDHLVIARMEALLAKPLQTEPE